jgi:hypothetical protein
MAGLGKGCDYFKSLPGILKIIEFVSFFHSLENSEILLQYLNEISQYRRTVKCPFRKMYIPGQPYKVI